MVTFRGHSRFYARNSAGKHPLDVAEIRAAFVASEGTRTQLRAFRQERLARIAANDGPVELPDNPKTILHVVPIGVVDPSIRFDVTAVANDSNSNFVPLYGRSWNNRINFDGALAWSPAPRDQPGAVSYTQLFHTGAIEGVEAFMLRREYVGRERPIPSVDFEKYLIAALGRYLSLAREVGATPPFIVALTLLGVRGQWMGVDHYFIDEPLAIDRDDLVIPETLVEDVALAPHTVLRPLLDAVWNACGWPRSPYFTDSGEWDPDHYRRR